jgi:hypothetical protein
MRPADESQTSSPSLTCSMLRPEARRVYPVRPPRVLRVRPRALRQRKCPPTRRDGTESWYWENQPGTGTTSCLGLEPGGKFTLPLGSLFC